MPNTNGVKRRTKSEQNLDGAVAMYKSLADLEHHLAKGHLALQQMTAAMTATVYQQYRERLDGLESEQVAT